VAVVLVAVLAGTAIGNSPLGRLFGGTQRIAWMEPAPPSAPVDLAGAPVLGSSQARVVVIEYGDFRCPACRQFALDVLPALRNEFIDRGTVALAFRQLPLEALHPLAMGDAVVSACAGRAGKFWDAYDLLYSRPESADAPDPASIALELGLDAPKMAACAADAAIAEDIRAEAARGRALGAHATPTFLVGLRTDHGLVTVVRNLIGGRSPDAFRQVLRPLIEGRS
jgi:protein-disulfide isomerase